MRKISKPVILFFLLCAAVTVIAQERVIEKNEFDSVYQKSSLLLKTRAYRSTMVRKTGGDSSPVGETSVYEFVPPDRYHSISTWTDDNGAVKKNESIRIGTKSWFRANDEPWRVSGIGSGNGSGAGSGMREIERVIGYKMTPGVKLETGTANLYQFTQTLRFEDRGGFFEATTSRDNWFNKEGLLLKSEYSLINTRLRMTYKTSTIYEYDPRITIEPPAVVPETKSN
jgi:hypothetical protein